MTGLISLIINDAKATIVVKAVYRQGQTIFLRVLKTDFFLSHLNAV